MGPIMRIKVKLFMKLLPGYALFFGFLLFLSIMFGLLINRPIGLFFLFISFASLRYLYRGEITYHCDHTKPCIALSMLIFFVCSLILVTLNMGISLLACVPLAIGLTWILHEFGVKKKLSMKKLRTFNVDTCTKEELLERCFELRLSKEKTEFCVKLFIEKTPHNKLADEYCIEPASITISKMRLKKKLNSR